MNDNLIDASTIVDSISRAKCDQQAEALLGKIQKRLEGFMPDEIGCLWSPIEKKVLDQIESAFEDHLLDVVSVICEDAIATVQSDNDPPSMPDIIDLSDVNGCDTAELVNAGDHLGRMLFLRAFVSKLSPMALEDLHSELMRS